jgi:hypothetical protein
MKKTALQQAIIEIAELWSSPSDQPNYVQVFDVLKSKLPVEEQQIIDAIVWFDDTDRTPSQIEISAKQYYNETFKSE